MDLSCNFWERAHNLSWSAIGSTPVPSSHRSRCLVTSCYHGHRYLPNSSGYPSSLTRCGSTWIVVFEHFSKVRHIVIISPDNRNSLFLIYRLWKWTEGENSNHLATRLNKIPLLMANMRIVTLGISAMPSQQDPLSYLLRLDPLRWLTTGNNLTNHLLNLWPFLLSMC